MKEDSMDYIINLLEDMIIFTNKFEVKSPGDGRDAREGGR